MSWDGVGWDGASAGHLDEGPFQPAEQCWFILARDPFPCVLCPLRKGTKKGSETWIAEEFALG